MLPYILTQSNNLENKMINLNIKNELQQKGIDFLEGFHTLPSSKVDILLEWADRYKYRKPIDANGSRARMFFQALARLKQA